MSGICRKMASCRWEASLRCIRPGSGKLRQSRPASAFERIRFGTRSLEEVCRGGRLSTFARKGAQPKAGGDHHGRRSVGSVCESSGFSGAGSRAASPMICRRSAILSSGAHEFRCLWRSTVRNLQQAAALGRVRPRLPDGGVGALSLSLSRPHMLCNVRQSLFALLFATGLAPAFRFPHEKVTCGELVSWNTRLT